MSRFSLFLILALALTTFARAAEIAWQPDYATALSKAKKTDRLVMLFIYSDWCPYCRQLNRVTFPDPDVIEASRQVVPVRVNGETKIASPLARKFGFLGYPTILFIDKDEQVQGKIPGYEGPETFAEDIDRFVESYESTGKMKARLAKDPKDSEANTWMAALSAWRSNVTQAEKHLAIARQGTYRGLWYARALCAIGDIHQIGRRFDQAISLFKEAVRTARDPHDRGYAMISIMYCYSAKDDRANMIAVAKQILNTPGVPEEYQDSARSEMKKIGVDGSQASCLPPEKFLRLQNLRPQLILDI